MKPDMKDVSRRRFISASLTSLASFGIFTASARNPRVWKKTLLPDTKKPITRILGKTGIEIPIVSMGVMNSFDPALVQYAYEGGMRHFDSAIAYGRGRNEEMIGSVLNRLKIRDQVVIATKIQLPNTLASMGAQEIQTTLMDMLDGSLKRLGTNHVDILYIHSVRDPQILAHTGITDAFLGMKKTGKARFIGFSTHSNMTACIREAATSDVHDVILTAFNYSLGEDRDLLEALEAAYRKKIGLIAMKTQCSQGWYRDGSSQNSRKYYEGTLLHSALLKWVLRHECITSAIPGVTTFQQVDEDMKVAFSLEYTEEEKQFFKDRNLQSSLGYCHQCAACIPTCRNRISLPDLMRVHMYAFSYGNFHHAHDTYDSIPHGGNLKQCRDCGVCSARCVRSIDIQGRIRDLKTVFC